MTAHLATRKARSVVKPPTSRRTKVGSHRYRVFRPVAIIAVVLVFLTPLLWMVMASLKTNVQIQDAQHTFNFTPTLSNYYSVMSGDNYGQFIFNSFFVASVATILSLILGVPAAYSMSRYMMRKSALVVLMARVIPGISLLVPWFYIFARLHLVGGYGVLIVSHMFILTPISVFVMMSFFDSLPIELEEAAQIDGLTPIGAFLRIVLPISAAGIATSAILSFIFSWNNFMFALVLSAQNTKTLPVAVFDFVSYASINWGAIMAAAVVMTLPIVVIALFAQKYIVSGLTAGATKG